MSLFQSLNQDDIGEKRITISIRASFVHPGVDELLFCMMVDAGAQHVCQRKLAYGRNRRLKEIEKISLGCI